MLFVTGIGRVTGDKISVEYKKQKWSYEGIKKLHRCLKDNSIVQNPVRDFGRMDTVSKMTVAAVALALYDASFSGLNSGIGIIGTSNTGSHSTNKEFFKDYVDSGRNMARGNLFVYTLPSAALASAAIVFGLEGPLFFEMYSNAPFYQLLKSTERVIIDQKCKGMIAVYADKYKVYAYLIEKLDCIPNGSDIMTIDELSNSYLQED